MTSPTPNLLRLDPNFHEPDRTFFRDFSPGDDFYEALIDAHRDLDESASADLNARLILILANHIGDLRVLREALQVARQSA
ncbi:MAG: hypothetical protein RIQ38_1069 [Pseudomonadota bacterium]